MCWRRSEERVHCTVSGKKHWGTFILTSGEAKPQVAKELQLLKKCEKGRSTVYIGVENSFAELAWFYHNSKTVLLTYMRGFATMHPMLKINLYLFDQNYVRPWGFFVHLPQVLNSSSKVGFHPWVLYVCLSLALNSWSNDKTKYRMKWNTWCKTFFPQNTRLEMNLGVAIEIENSAAVFVKAATLEADRNQSTPFCLIVEQWFLRIILPR